MNWKPLPIPAFVGVDFPPLLISTLFHKDAYTIHLTDLAHIWTESLDRKAIVRRSHDESTSVDPSSSPDQFAIFLNKIKLGLSGEKNTTCALTIGSAGEGRPALDLRVTVNLPGGLAPLEWPIHLSTGPASAMKNHLILPLLRTQHIRMKEIEGLRETIREKDHIIQKVVDKLEASGIDLGQIFAQAVGKPGRKSDWNRDRVNGMTSFDWDTWKQKFGVEAIGTAELVSKILGTDEACSAISGEPQNTESGEDWWGSIQGLTIDLNSGKISTKNGSRKSKSKIFIKADLSSPKEPETAAEESRLEEDAFRPPTLAKPLSNAEDLHTPSQSSKLPPSTSTESSVTLLKSAPKPKKTIGKIGGKKQATTPDHVPETEPETEETQSELELDNPESSANTLPKNPTPEPLVAKPKKKLGQIGGKTKKEATPALEQQPEPSVPTPIKRKIGIIGNKPKASNSKEEVMNNHTERHEENKVEVTASRGRVSVKPERSPSPPPRETSVERADKKREQLKRELEQKAKAPAKKKRKL